MKAHNDLATFLVKLKASRFQALVGSRVLVVSLLGNKKKVPERVKKKKTCRQFLGFSEDAGH